MISSYRVTFFNFLTRNSMSQILEGLWQKKFCVSKKSKFPIKFLIWKVVCILLPKSKNFLGILITLIHEIFCRNPSSICDIVFQVRKLKKVTLYERFIVYYTEIKFLKKFVRSTFILFCRRTKFGKNIYLMVLY